MQVCQLNYKNLAKTSNGWGYCVGLTQPSTAALKAAGASAWDASSGGPFHSIANEKNKCRWMFVLGWGTLSLFGLPREVRSLAVSVPSAGVRSTRPLITLYTCIKVALLVVLLSSMGWRFRLVISGDALMVDLKSRKMHLAERRWTASRDLKFCWWGLHLAKSV